MEIWKDITNYEGYYQVSDEGRVRSLVRLLPEAIDAGIRKQKQLLRFGKNTQGRLQVTLCKEGKTKRFQVHTLVLTTFKGERPEGLEGCHNDGNHLNNRIDNLRWDTRVNNFADKKKHSTQTRGQDAPRAKLDDYAVREIKKSKLTGRILAQLYGVSQVTIHFIKTGKTWSHIK